MNTIWADDASVPPGDRGLAYGDGVFETIRMQGTGGVLLERHVARMVAGAAVLGIPCSEGRLREVIRLAVARYAGAAGSGGWVLKLVLTRGVGGRGYRPTGATASNLIVSSARLPPEPCTAGVVAATSDVPLTVNPRLAGIKTLNRLEQVMASRELTDELYEVIMANQSGELVEGTRTNLLAKVRGRWLTPPVSQLAVAGVMRDYVVRHLEQEGERIELSAISPAALAADGSAALYLMNSLMGVVPVRRMDGRDLPADRTLATIFNPLDLVESQV
ncbi:MAG: aminodeoxychorismate lyase [Pseudomonadota bacterium]